MMRSTSSGFRAPIRRPSLSFASTPSARQVIDLSVSFAKTPSGSQVIDLSAAPGNNRGSMITLLLHVFRLLPFLFGGHRQLALENLALRQQLAVYKRTTPWVKSVWSLGHHDRIDLPVTYARSRIAVVAFSSQYAMPISRYIVVAVARWSWASSRLPMRR